MLNKTDRFWWIRELPWMLVTAVVCLLLLAGLALLAGLLLTILVIAL